MENQLNFNFFLGIDVSKDSLDIFDTKTKSHFHINNKSNDIKKFIKEHNISNDTLIIIDSTGGYEQKCIDIFYQTNFTLHRADGRRVKNFLRCLGQSAKTDELDAYGLALYGQKLHENLHFYEPHDIVLQQLFARLIDLKDYHQREKNRYHAPKIPDIVKKNIKQILLLLDKQIAEFEREIMDIINNDSKLKRKFTILTNYCGIAQKSAIVLICALPELGIANRRQIAALAGVAPYANDSGKFRGKRKIKHARDIIKGKLFLPAKNAARTNPQIRVFYQRLTQNGKLHRTAIIACLRKILITLNAILKEEMAKE